MHGFAPSWPYSSAPHHVCVFDACGPRDGHLQRYKKGRTARGIQRALVTKRRVRATAVFFKHTVPSKQNKQPYNPGPSAYSSTDNGAQHYQVMLTDTTPSPPHLYKDGRRDLLVQG